MTSPYSDFLGQVRHQHGDQIGSGDGLCRLGHFQPVLLGLLPAGATLAHADHDIEAAVLEIQGVGTALAAIAEHCDTRTACSAFLFTSFCEYNFI